MRKNDTFVEGWYNSLFELSMTMVLLMADNKLK